MSIVIKSDQVNTLIFKYLLEQGFEHAAYSLLHEARLEESLSQGPQVKAGHLLHLLERALLFNQIETHIDLVSISIHSQSQYCQCTDDFELTKPHLCTITERKRPQQTIQQAQTQVLTKYAPTDVFVRENRKMPQQELTLEKARPLKLSSVHCRLAVYHHDLLVIYDDHLRVLLFWTKHPEKDFSIQHIAPLLEDEQYGKAVELMIMEDKRVVAVLDSKWLCVYSSQGYLLSTIQPCCAEYSSILTDSQDLLAFQGIDGLNVVSISQGALLYSHPEVSCCEFRNGSTLYFLTRLTGNLHFIDFGAYQGEEDSLKTLLCIPPSEFEATQMQWNKNRTLLGIFSRKSNQIRVYLHNGQGHIMQLSDQEQMVGFQWGGSDNGMVECIAR